jgi:plastocyanin
MVSATPLDTFVSSDVTVNVGEMVTWTNTGGTHNVKFNDGSFEQPSPANGTAWTVSRTFATAGDYRYYCSIHGTATGGMSGFVHVVAPGTNPPPGATPPPAGGGGSPGGGSTGGGSPESGSPQKTPFTVTLRSSRAKGAKVRFFGSVRPAQDGRLALIQVRSRGGRYKTVVRVRLKHARGDQSVFSVRLRVARVGVFRARVLGAGDHSTGTSGTRRVKPA